MALKTVHGAPAGPHKGRGATDNPEGRFERVEREAFDDGWETSIEDDPSRPRTTVTAERARGIVTRNQSPDVPFNLSINPYRGCEHGCVYCMSGDSAILMADGRTRMLADIRPGDVVYGTRRKGWYRRYVASRVLAHWRTIKAAYRIVLEDGTQLISGGDHRFLTEHGWKYVTPVEPGSQRRRPGLTVRSKLMGVGQFADAYPVDHEYKRGYLCGMVQGDGLLASYQYLRPGRHGDRHQFGLALCAAEALSRTREFLSDFDVLTNELRFQAATGNRREMLGIRTHARMGVDRVRELCAWPSLPDAAWKAGFLAGIFDAEGSFSQGVLRISNTDQRSIDATTDALRAFGFRWALEHVTAGRMRPIQVVRIMGGLREHLRFFHLFDPAISGKREIFDVAVKSSARLRVVSIEPVGRACILYDMTTETGDFIANGVVSHNCYARPSHAYLDLSPGLDFETRLFAKDNAAEVLREELAKPGHKVEPIAIGVNTDAYQPTERTRRITRSVLEVLAQCEHPCTLVTKNALIERDIDLLAPMAQKNLVQAFVSVTTLDHDLARRMEPRASAPARRIEAIRRLAAAGIPTGVMVAPVIPFLTDSELESILEAAVGAGASNAGYVLMRLPWEVKDLFSGWLQHHYPLKAAHVMSRVRAMRNGRENDPNFGSRMRGDGLFAQLLGKRFEAACARLRLDRERMRALDCGRFKPPRTGPQLSLF